MKREILDAAKRRNHYDWLAIEGKHVVVPAEAGTIFGGFPLTRE